jgi:hypothetical protein
MSWPHRITKSVSTETNFPDDYLLYATLTVTADRPMNTRYRNRPKARLGTLGSAEAAAQRIAADRDKSRLAYLARWLRRDLELHIGRMSGDNFTP